MAPLLLRACHSTVDCLRNPSNWCSGAGQHVAQLDCDGDQLDDWACLDLARGERSLMLSSQQCKPLIATAPTSSCPTFFNQTCMRRAPPPVLLLL